jgi:hypothetical protein
MAFVYHWFKLNIEKEIKETFISFIQQQLTIYTIEGIIKQSAI